VVLVFEEKVIGLSCLLETKPRSEGFHFLRKLSILGLALFWSHLFRERNDPTFLEIAGWFFCRFLRSSKIFATNPSHQLKKMPSTFGISYFLQPLTHLAIYLDDALGTHTDNNGEHHSRCEH
jgi:hypothetical protein